MKVVTWTYLRGKLRPDVALLQEARPPGLTPGEHLVFEHVSAGWGTAIYGRNLSLEPLHIRTEYPGRVVAAALTLEAGRRLAVVSIHAPIIKNRLFPHLEAIFTSIEALLKDGTGIVGGDLNTARVAARYWPGFGHDTFWSSIDAGRFL
jgi:hypothetical protein